MGIQRTSSNIHQERILAEGIEMNLDPSNVSENLKYQTADHPGKEAPGPITNAKVELDEKAQSEESDIEGVPWKRWNVFETG